ncbi:AMP-binding protein, partial [Myxococcota bacterium]
MARFIRTASERHPSAEIREYDSLWRWSVSEPESFWRLMLEVSGLVHTGPVEPTLAPREWPGSRYFPEVELNFAENLLRHRDDQVALISVSESRPTREFTFAQLSEKVAHMAAALQSSGVGRGDRVVGFLPNTDEAIIAMLGAASLGAIWSSCSPDFGAQGVLDRFGQIEPKVLLAANGYTYGGKVFDCTAKLTDILAKIPSIETLVLLPYVESHSAEVEGAKDRLTLWDRFVARRSGATDIPFAKLPFNHPLYIMYSSGTTGLPKSIVHGAGGTLLQHAKEHLLHTDLRRCDNLLYFTTCGWMMWNWQVSSLFAGNAITLFDGSPGLPGPERLWQVVA